MRMPLYFPFAVASPASMVRLKSYFEKIAVYQALDYPTQKASAPGMDNDLWQIITPVAGDEKEIAAVLKDFKNYIDLHKDAPLAFLKAQSSRIPFFTDTSVSKIRSDLKNLAAGNAAAQNTAEPARDSLFAARLFLAAAKEHDVHYFDLLEAMASQEKMEQTLYDRIKGEPGDVERLFPALTQNADEDPGNTMTEERIKAWSVVLLHDSSPPGVFVTDSPAVMNYLESRGPRLTPVFSIDGLLTGQDKNEAMRKFKRELADVLDQCAAGPALDNAVCVPVIPSAESQEETGSLTVAVVPGVDPRKYFSSFAPRAATKIRTGIKTGYSSTVICRVSPPSFL
jgi:hypothetical protein